MAGRALRMPRRQATNAARAPRRSFMDPPLGLAGDNSRMARLAAVTPLSAGPSPRKRRSGSSMNLVHVESWVQLWGRTRLRPPPQRTAELAPVELGHFATGDAESPLARRVVVP